MHYILSWVLPILAMTLSACNESTSSPETPTQSNTRSTEIATNTTSPPPPIPSATPSPSSIPTNSLVGTATLDGEELDFLTLINDYRSQNSVPKLQVSISLTRASDWLSSDMAAKNYFNHNDSSGRDPFSRISSFGYDFSGTAGENIAAGNSTAQATFEQWKSSPGHNANMLNLAYRVIGIGRIGNTSSSYKWYWTTDFGSKVDETVN